jgi:hypothetical protein
VAKWYTLTFEGRVGQPVRVRVSPSPSQNLTEVYGETRAGSRLAFGTKIQLFLSTPLILKNILCGKFSSFFIFESHEIPVCYKDLLSSDKIICIQIIHITLRFMADRRKYLILSRRDFSPEPLLPVKVLSRLFCLSNW